MSTSGEKILFVVPNVFQKPFNGVIGDIIFTDRGIYYMSLFESDQAKKGMVVVDDDGKSEREKFYGTSLDYRVSLNKVSLKIRAEEFEKATCENEKIRITGRGVRNLVVDYPTPDPAIVDAINRYPDCAPLYDQDADPLGHYLPFPKVDLLLGGLARREVPADLAILGDSGCLEDQRYLNAVYRNLIDHSGFGEIVTQLVAAAEPFRAGIVEIAKKQSDNWRSEMKKFTWIAIGVPAAALPFSYFLFIRDGDYFWGTLGIGVGLAWMVIGLLFRSRAEGRLANTKQIEALLGS